MFANANYDSLIRIPKFEMLVMAVDVPKKERKVLVPAEFRLFMRSHPRECYKALFEAAKETLFTLAADPKYIGSANIGATGVLHT